MRKWSVRQIALRKSNKKSSKNVNEKRGGKFVKLRQKIEKNLEKNNSNFSFIFAMFSLKKMSICVKKKKKKKKKESGKND